ncbi:MAG TPA: translocation/assembly module TamB domain-containing protein [Blastocatellia bacterium]|nr:translocation/assembly module TamB domain-containing protein [Blastocatellia bacterium]
MRRKILIGALSLVTLLLLLALAGFIYIRSGKLDKYLERQIVAALADSGIRAEMGRTHLDLRGYKVTIEDLKLFSARTGEPIGSVGRIEAEFSVTDYFKQEINITRVDIVHPAVWLSFNEQGRLNIETLESPAEPAEKGARVKFLTASLNVRGGEINFDDRRNDIIARVEDLSGSLVPLSPVVTDDRFDHRIVLSFDKARGSYQGRALDHLAANVEATVRGEEAQIERLKLVSDLGEATASGRISSFKPLKYEVEFAGRVVLEQLARLALPGMPINGRANLDGKIEGTGADYHVAAKIESDSIAAAGFHVDGIRMTTSGDGSGSQYTATINAATGSGRGSGFSLESVRLSEARLKGKDADFDILGKLALESVKGGEVTVSGIRGLLAADNKQLTLSEFTANVLGGTATGSATLAYARGASNVELRFAAIDLNQASMLAAGKDIDVRGTAAGNARLTFAGFDYRAASGRIEASFDGAFSPPQPSAEVTVTGQFSAGVAGRSLNIERAFAKTAKSEVTASGTIGWDRTGALDVKFKSEDMAEVQRVVDAFGVIPENIRDEYAFSLTGEGGFTGRVEGSLTSPEVRGRLVLSSIRAGDEEAGAFQGDIAYTRALLSVGRASLVRGEGSRVDFALTAPLDGEDKKFAVKAGVLNFPLTTIVRMAQPVLKDLVGGGTVNGVIDLRGLPGPRTIEGTAEVTLSGGEFNLPSPDEKEETTSVSVPEFDGKVTISKSLLTVENLKMTAGDATINGAGTFDLDTYAFSVDGSAKNVNLEPVSRAIPADAQLTGRADVVIKGEGKWDEWSATNLSATVQGQSVAINGRDLGNAKVVLFTENQTLRIEAAATLLDQPRTLEARIDLRDKSYPIAGSIEFTDTEIGPYLGLVASELSGISGRATGTITLRGPLQEPDQIQAVANLSKLEFGGAIGGGRQYTIENQGAVVMTASSKAITLDRVSFTGEGTSVTLGGVLSRADEAASTLSIEGEINLRLISSFTNVVTTTGVAQVQASIAGTLDRPRLVGLANLRDVGVRVLDFPLAMARGSGQIRFTTDQAQIENFKASTPGGGTLTISGGAALSGLAPDRWRIETRADEVGASYPRDTQTVFDASLVLQGNRRVQVLSGGVDIRRATYTKELTIEELIRTGGPFGAEFLETGPGGGGGPSALPTSLDIRIEADNTLIVRNNLADAVGSTYLNLRGPIESPMVYGRVQFNRGTLEFRNGRYEMTRGIITLPGRRRAQPVVDFQSEADISGYHVWVAFNGAIDKLQTTIRSDPELPQGELISLILTGNVNADRSNNPTSLETGLGLAQSLLAASLSEQLEKHTQRLFGLSRLSIDPLLGGRGADPTARVTVGQRITKDLSITYSQNLTSSGVSGVDRIVLVEYRISNRFSIVGIRNERGDLGFDVRIRKRF